MKYAFVREHRRRWPVGVQCRVLGVARRGYYAWRRREASGRIMWRHRVLREIRRSFLKSRPGNCYDNAVVESFHGTLKSELVNRRNYATRREEIGSIFEYIEVFYNRQRRHSTLGYVSPVAFENLCGAQPLERP